MHMQLMQICTTICTKYITKEMFLSVTAKPQVHIKKKKHCTSVSVFADSETTVVYTIPSVTKASKPGLLQT